jgi:8-oxo-dGTP pyrophosphatase MutT (NUDIX family)
MQPWTILSSRYLLRRWWMNLRQDHVRLANGTELEEFHVLEYPDWVSVLCLTGTDEVVLVQQYRHGIGQVTLELPAGALDAGEDPLEAARRELLEETGYASDDWHALGTVVPEPSRHSNRAHLFLARQSRYVQPPELDDAEAIAVQVRPLAEVLHLADTGAIGHGIHVAALFWARFRGLL